MGFKEHIASGAILIGSLLGSHANAQQTQQNTAPQAPAMTAPAEQQQPPKAEAENTIDLNSKVIFVQPKATDGKEFKSFTYVPVIAQDGGVFYTSPMKSENDTTVSTRVASAKGPLETAKTVRLTIPQMRAELKKAQENPDKYNIFIADDISTSALGTPFLEFKNVQWLNGEAAKEAIQVLDTKLASHDGREAKNPNYAEEKPKQQITPEAQRKYLSNLKGR